MTVDRWLAICGLFLGLVGLGAAYFFYRRQVRERLPTFVINPRRKCLVHSDCTRHAGFLLRFNSREIGSAGVSAVEVYFWNSGSLDIPSSAVRKPYFIRIHESCILSYRILKTNRDVLHVEVTGGGGVSDALELSFDILEPGDGAVIEIIYEGPINAQIDFGGVSVGALKPVVLESNLLYFTTPNERVRNALMSTRKSAMVFGGVFGLVVLSNFLVDRFHFERAYDAWGAIMLCAVMVALFGVLLWDKYKRMTAKSVPPDLRR